MARSVQGGSTTGPADIETVLGPDDTDRQSVTIAPRDGSDTDQIAAILAALADTLAVTGTVSIAGSIAVTGTFFQATQPVSVASLPLPSGAATDAGLAAILAKLITAPATEAKQDASVVQETASATALGTTADAAVTTNTTGTVSGKLRGLIALIAAKIGITIADGDSVTIGAKADAKSTATDTTPISAMSVWKQISASVQAFVTALGSPFQAGGSIGNTSFGATQSGTWTVQPGNTANTTAWKVDGSAVTQPASLASLPALAAGTAVIGSVFGWAARVSASSTRSNNTTTYAAGQAWSTAAGAVMTFAGCFRGAGLVSRIASLIVTDSAYVVASVQGELWLFNAAPTAIPDLAAFTLTDAEMATFVGKVPFVIDSAGLATVGAGGNSCTTISGIGLDVAGAADANLYGLIKILNAYVPVANEILTFYPVLEGQN